MILRGWVATPVGLEPVFFVPPRAQTNKTGTYEQQVVTRVAGYSWCLACAWHALGMRLGFAEPSRLFHDAFGLLGKLLAGFLGAALRSGGTSVLGRGQASNGSSRQIALAGLAGFLARLGSPVLFAPLAQTVLWIMH